MIVSNQKLLLPSYKLQSKSTGFTTKNYVAFNHLEKKYLKEVRVLRANQDLFQSYLLVEVFQKMATKLHLPSLLGVSILKIQLNLELSRGNYLTYYMERDFQEHSLKAIFESSSKLPRKQLADLISQLLKIFLEEAGNKLPLLCPASILVSKEWDGLKLSVNRTNLAGFKLLVEGEAVLLSKFKQIYGYLHPDCYDWELNQMKINFNCKLYSFALNLFSLVLSKEISYPLYASRDQVTFQITESRQYIKRSYDKVRNSFESRVLRDQIQQLENKLGSPGPKLWQFFEEIFIKQRCRFDGWSSVISHFDPSFFTSCLATIPSTTFESLKYIYSCETAERKQHYQEMGIVRENCLAKDNHQELSLYSAIKYNRLQGLIIRTSSQAESFDPQLLTFYRQLQEEARSLKAFSCPQQGPEEINFTSQLRVSEQFSISSLRSGEWDGTDSSVRMFSCSDSHEILSCFESSFWL